MLISIVAVGENYEIGKDNDLLWHLPGDLKFFKEHTMGKKIIMGRKTFESFKSPLKGREHIVLTKNPGPSNYENVVFTNDKDSLVEQYKDSEEEVYVIGGASIYKAFLEDIKKMYLTEIKARDNEAETFYPTFDKNEWESQELSSNEDNNIVYKHVLYTRKKR
jgi:dihydrofolate reductase